MEAMSIPCTFISISLSSLSCPSSKEDSSVSKSRAAHEAGSLRQGRGRGGPRGDMWATWQYVERYLRRRMCGSCVPDPPPRPLCFLQ